MSQNERFATFGIFVLGLKTGVVGVYIPHSPDTRLVASSIYSESPYDITICSYLGYSLWLAYQL